MDKASKHISKDNGAKIIMNPYFNSLASTVVIRYTANIFEVIFTGHVTFKFRYNQI